jgi:hypothetical protein
MKKFSYFSQQAQEEKKDLEERGENSRKIYRVCGRTKEDV